MIGDIIMVAFIIVLAFSGACETTGRLMRDASGQRIQRSRAAAYGLCVLIVLAVSVGLGLMVALPVEPGDEMYDGRVVATEYRPGLSEHERDEKIIKAFCVLLIPSLLGVRVALGKKPKAS
jgi:hypothetical protein